MKKEKQTTARNTFTGKIFFLFCCLLIRAHFACAISISNLQGLVDNVDVYIKATNGNITFHSRTSTYLTLTVTTSIDLDGLSTITSHGTYNLPAGSHIILPLIIPSGVTLTSNSTGWTNPTCPIISSSVYRSPNDLSCSNIVSKMFFFAMEPGDYSGGTCTGCTTTVSNLKFRGASLNWQDYNAGTGISGLNACPIEDYFCSCIIIPRPDNIFDPVVCNCTGYNYDITNCQFTGFDHTAIFADKLTDKIKVDHCFVEKTKGISTEGIGYGMLFNSVPATYAHGTQNVVLNNNIYDDNKSCVDGSPGPVNWEFFDNTTTQFSGSINKHNSESGYPYWHPVGPAGSFFYDGSRKCTGNDYCCVQADNSQINHFTILDPVGGDVDVYHNIFTKAAFSLPYPVTGMSKVTQSSSLSLLTGSNIYLCQGGINAAQAPVTLIDSHIPLLDNNGWSGVPLGFGFDFFGNTYNECIVSTNGFIKFGSSTDGYNAIPSFKIPDKDNDPKNIIALCWADLNPDGVNLANISYFTIHNGGNDDIFVVEYSQVPGATGWGGTLTGQIRLYRSTGKIEVFEYYDDIATSNANPNHKILGLENEAGDRGKTPSDRNFDDAPWTVAGEMWTYFDPSPGIMELYTVAVQDNTFAISHNPTNVNCANGAGVGRQALSYADIADNWIESDCWANDGHLITANNSFNYKQGNPVASITNPQPPEVWLDLTDANGTSLPVTYNKSITPGHDRTQYVTIGDAFNLVTNGGNLPNSGNETYIIRTNPDNALPETNIQVIGSSTVNITEYYNNYFLDGELYATAHTTPCAYTNHSATAHLAGLFGIDVLAVDNTNNYASTWQHIPLIVNDPNQEKHLIFNIKDSYQEFHNILVSSNHNATAPTYVYKQVELNGAAIWRQDIALGGDGWERVDIDLTKQDLEPSSASILSHLTTDGSKNELTFSIYIPNGSAVDAKKVKGLIVWVDDVYLKKAGSLTGENLIKDGSVELTTLTPPQGLPITPDETSAWYSKNLISNYSTCPQPLNAATPLAFLPDGTAPLSYTPPDNFSSSATISLRDRKSGSKAVQLMFNEVSCANYAGVESAHANNNHIVSSAATEIDFTDLLECDEYPNYNSHTHNPSYDLSTWVAGGIPPASIDIAHAYYLDGPMTLSNNATLTLQGCVVVMTNPLSKIIVPNTSTLKITDNGTINSHLFSCGDMWQGIKVEQGGTAIIGGNGSNNTFGTLIEDALTAIDCDACTLKVGYTTFDQNNTAIHLLNAIDNTSYINGATFKCTGGVLTKHPYPGTVPQFHILLENATYGASGEIPIGYSGSNSTIAYINYYSDALYAIYGIKSNFDVYRSEFNMPEASSGATAITAEGTSFNTLRVIPNAGDSISRFSNGLCGIWAKGMGTVEIKGNTFDNAKNASLSLFGYTTDVENNTYTKCKLAVGIYEGVDVSQATTNAPVANTVSRNVINSGLPYDAGTYGYTGIDVECGTSTNLNLSVQNNIVWNCVDGIHLIDINHGNVSSSDGSITHGNDIHYTLPGAEVPNNYQHGIWLQNCDKVQVANNIVGWASATNETPDGNNLDYLKGIAIETSTSCELKENLISNIEAGVNADGNCSLSNLYCNTMSTCYHGVYLENNTAVITDQGTSTESWKNKWVDINPTSPSTRVEQGGIFNPTIKWYYNTSDGSDYEPNPCNLFFVQPTQANASNGCNAPDPIGGGQREAAFGGTVRDSTIDDPDSTYFSYSSKEAFYKAAKNDSTILSMNMSSDTIFQNKFIELQQSNIGRYDEVTESLASGNKSAALQKLAAIIDQSLIDQNKKYVASVVANGYNPYMDVDSDTVSALGIIAHLHPFYGGEAVYWARAILHLKVHDELPPMRRAQHKPNVVAYTSLEKLFPNPANNTVAFSSDKEFGVEDILCVYNCLQQKLYEYKLPLKAKSFSFDATDIKQGIYIVKHLTAESLVSENKLVIIR